MHNQVAAQRCRGAAEKTAKKIVTDEKSFDLFVTEMMVDLSECEYPSIETMVMYASWMTRRRQKACLAQRADSGPRREGLGKTTIRNMLTELFSHSWPRRYPAWAALSKAERATYEDEVLTQVLGLYKLSSGAVDVDPVAAERAAQLRVQTGMVTSRKHFFKTEVYQVQDAILQEERVNWAIVLGAALALLQSTAARSGMLTTDSFDSGSHFWGGEHPLRVRDIKHSVHDVISEWALPRLAGADDARVEAGA